MPELAEVVDGQSEEVDEGVGEEVHSEESGDDNDSIPDLEETEEVADGDVAATGGGTLSKVVGHEWKDYHYYLLF